MKHYKVDFESMPWQTPTAGVRFKSYEHSGRKLRFAEFSIVKNPGFDEDADGNGLPDHWSTSHKQIRWREKVFMGKDYEVISQPKQYVLATQNIALKKGQRYTVTLRCKGEGGGLEMTRAHGGILASEWSIFNHQFGQRGNLGAMDRTNHGPSGTRC